MEWQQMSVAETLRTLGVSAERGLTLSEAQKRARTDGRNVLRNTRKKSFLRRFLAQFQDFMVIILLIASAVSFVTTLLEENGDLADPIIILVIVLINAIIGTVQESKAEKAIESLQKLSAPLCRVRRDGAVCRLPAAELVRGDILLLEEGDCVPADARLLQTVGLYAEESALTGESIAVEKDARLLFSAREPIAEQRNMVFAGTSVASGHGWAVVTEIGMQTQMGRIAALLRDENSPQTPLQQRLTHVGKVLGIAAMAVCAVIFIMGLLQQAEPISMFMIAVSLAVAAIPEGLPAVVTIVLALGVRRMANKRAIIRRLPAVETLGSATVICSDKTGTLTQNKMTVVQLANATETISLQSEEGKQVLLGAALCNNAVLTSNGAEGDPTEKALLLAAKEARIQPKELAVQYPRTAEHPFDSERKYMATMHRNERKYLCVVKGAPEVVLAMCTSYRIHQAECLLTDDMRARISAQIRSLSQQSLRVIAVAMREYEQYPKTDMWETQLCFVGMVGLLDPPRPEVRQAVLQCRKAGIRPIMITGDHALTASAIARQLGILQEHTQVLTGTQLDEMDPQALEKAAQSCAVYARVTPEHKMRIVRALQKRGEVVAMTGDGVNDAPALKAADIGCAMGQSGTEVAKTAADMILTDDCFSTIVAAVEEGRGIYANIQKAIHFLLSCNIGEIFTVFVAFLLRLPSPLLAIQLLWVNLVTDSLPALALGVEPTEQDVMQRKPLSRTQSLFAGGLWSRILTEGLLIGSLSFLAYVVGRSCFDADATQPLIGRTMAFAVLSFSQLVHAFNTRSERSLFAVGLGTNRKMLIAFLIGMCMQVSVITVPLLSGVFRTAALTLLQWVIVAVLSLVPLAVIELEKAVKRRKG